VAIFLAQRDSTEDYFQKPRFFLIFSKAACSVFTAKMVSQCILENFITLVTIMA
jgi:hypothetical protein